MAGRRCGNRARPQLFDKLAGAQDPRAGPIFQREGVFMGEIDKVEHNEGESRYELNVDSQVAIADYKRRDGALLFTHTQVPAALKGQGIGSKLIGGALQDARSKGLKVVPLCAFVAAYLERHPEEQDLLAVDAPG